MRWAREEAKLVRRKSHHPPCPRWRGLALTATCRFALEQCVEKTKEQGLALTAVNKPGVGPEPGSDGRRVADATGKLVGLAACRGGDREVTIRVECDCSDSSWGRKSVRCAYLSKTARSSWSSSSVDRDGKGPMVEYAGGSALGGSRSTSSSSDSSATSRARSASFAVSIPFLCSIHLRLVQ